MGDYKNHSKETGTGLCSSYEDVFKFNRANKGEIAERVRLDRKMRKFAHYATRYNEHLRSVELDRKRGGVLKSQVDFILSKSNKYAYQEFQFIE